MERKDFNINIDLHRFISLSNEINTRHCLRAVELKDEILMCLREKRNNITGLLDFKWIHELLFRVKYKIYIKTTHA